MAYLTQFRRWQASSASGRFAEECHLRGRRCYVICGAAPMRPPSLLRNVKIGERALERLGGAGHRLAEGRMRMDREADVRRVAAVLDGERYLADQLPRVAADDAASQQAVVGGIE